METMIIMFKSKFIRYILLWIIVGMLIHYAFGLVIPTVVIGIGLYICFKKYPDALDCDYQEVAA